MSQLVPSPADRESAECLVEDIRGAVHASQGSCSLSYDLSEDEAVRHVASALARARLAGAEAAREACAALCETQGPRMDGHRWACMACDYPDGGMNHSPRCGKPWAELLRALDLAAVVGARPAPEGAEGTR